jgi:hypothetical protein
MRRLAILLAAPMLAGCGTDHEAVVSGAFDKEVTSANVSLSLVLDAADGESAIHVAGPYAAGAPPRFDWRFRRHGPPGQVRSRMVSNGARVFFVYGDQTYEAEEDWIRTLRKRASGPRVGPLGSEDLGDLVRRVRTWIGAGAAYEDAKLDGEQVTRVTGRLDPDAAVAELDALARQAGGAPPPEEFDAAGGKTGRYTVDVAHADGKLRRVHARLPVVQLGGVPATLEFSLRLKAVDKPVRIEAPDAGEDFTEFRIRAAADFSSTRPQGEDAKVRAEVLAANRIVERAWESFRETVTGDGSTNYDLAAAAWKFGRALHRAYWKTDALPATPDYERAVEDIEDAIASYGKALSAFVAAYEARSEKRMDAAAERILHADDAYRVALAFFY